MLEQVFQEIKRTCRTSSKGALKSWFTRGAAGELFPDDLSGCWTWKMLSHKLDRCGSFQPSQVASDTPPVFPCCDPDASCSNAVLEIA